MSDQPELSPGLVPRGQPANADCPIETVPALIDATALTDDPGSPQSGYQDVARGDSHGTPDVTSFSPTLHHHLDPTRCGSLGWGEVADRKGEGGVVCRSARG